jgi:hypothetical protein
MGRFLADFGAREEILTRAAYVLRAASTRARSRPRASGHVSAKATAQVAPTEAAAKDELGTKIF